MSNLKIGFKTIKGGLNKTWISQDKPFANIYISTNTINSQTTLTEQYIKVKRKFWSINALLIYFLKYVFRWNYYSTFEISKCNQCYMMMNVCMNFLFKAKYIIVFKSFKFFWFFNFLKNLGCYRLPPLKGISSPRFEEASKRLWRYGYHP